ncbi:MAG TPA: hypothetical protein DDW50_05390, partial [Firmicutes bacterium]|nr:hypothetical protein [Bacillota bacterium]
MRSFSMTRRWLVPIIVLLLLVVASGSAFGMSPFKIDSYVTDKAQLLSENERGELASRLDKYARDTGNQLLVVTIPSLENEELTDFTENLFKLNKPGQKGKDNGLIFLVALKEHQVRIEVGYGLEAVLPDGKTGAIIREQITPFFKSNDYYGGLSSGVDAMIAAISPKYVGGNPSSIPVRKSSDHAFPFAFLVAVVIFFISIFGNIGRSARQQHYRHRRGFSEPWYWGGGGGGFSGGGFGGGSSDGGGFS